MTVTLYFLNAGDAIDADTADELLEGWHQTSWESGLTIDEFLESVAWRAGFDTEIDPATIKGIDFLKKLVEAQPLNYRLEDTGTVGMKNELDPNFERVDVLNGQLPD